MKNTKNVKGPPAASANDDAAMPAEQAAQGLDKLLTTEDVAQWLGIRKCTLEKARSTRMGDFPPFIKVGRSIRYRRGDVERWLDRHAYQVDGSRAFPAAA